MIDDDVLRAARRLYLGTSTDIASDEATVRHWALKRWPRRIPKEAEALAFWVLSDAAQETCREQEAR